MLAFTQLPFERSSQEGEKGNRQGRQKRHKQKKQKSKERHYAASPTVTRVVSTARHACFRMNTPTYSPGCQRLLLWQPVESKNGHTTGGSGPAAHGGAAGRGGPGRMGRRRVLFAQNTTVPRARQGIEDNCPEHLFGRTNKGNPI